MEGYLPDSLSAYLAGMSIRHHNDAAGHVTILLGQLKDQSEFLGVLNTLANRHYNVISTRIKND